VEKYVSVKSIAADRLTESKRRVITLLRDRGPQTKAFLTENARLGWATVVKVINQLTDEGIIYCAGTTPSNESHVGNPASLYALRLDRPLAIGIDVEYKTTRVVLTNLAGEILKEGTHRTPHHAPKDEVKRFFQNCIEEFVADGDISPSDLAGIGIGIPGIGFPSRYRKDNAERARELERYLGEIFDTPVRIGTNTHSYAVFEKWSNDTFPASDFIFLSIRTGVGTGIFLRGHLYTGMNGLAGEIGHMKVVANGSPCRCGSVGCLETVVNQHYLLQQYRTNVLKDPTWCLQSDPNCLYDGLSDLFSRAKAGEKDARAVVDTAARYLGESIANAMVVLDITNIVMSGHFGEDGDAIVEPMREVIRERILPNVPFDLRYCSFDPDGYTLGAALLVLRDFFVDIPSE